MGKVVFTGFAGFAVFAGKKVVFAGQLITYFPKLDRLPRLSIS